ESLSGQDDRQPILEPDRNPCEVEGSRPQLTMWYKCPDRPLPTYSLPTMSGCRTRVTARVLHADAPVLCGLLAEWRALIANMTVPELRVPPALTSAHHHIHLDRRAQRQGGHADRGAGRVGLGEVPAVRLVHRAELRHVGQVDPDPDHVV